MSLDFENDAPDNDNRPRASFPWSWLLIIVGMLIMIFLYMGQDAQIRKQDAADAAARAEIWCAQHPGYFCNRKGN